MDHDDNGRAPADQAKCGPDGRHTAPQPAGSPTACPCGLISRHPAAIDMAIVRLALSSPTFGCGRPAGISS